MKVVPQKIVDSEGDGLVTVAVSLDDSEFLGAALDVDYLDGPTTLDLRLSIKQAARLWGRLGDVLRKEEKG
ncbi:MAG: hypothetical protein OXI63_07230 [Candidatus Poribacteria bacterium]|nr:hypothetical protein [Candidatus Poribacteria bacterium]